MLWMNGAPIPEKDVNPSRYGSISSMNISCYLTKSITSLLRLIRKERNLMLSLTSLGLTRNQAVELFTQPTVSAAQNDNGQLDGVFDASDRPEGGGVIVWWNDMEKDKR